MTGPTPSSRGSASSSPAGASSTASGASRAESSTRAERECQILTVAIRLFAQKGFAQTDVQRIADEVGIGKGTIYRHFESKVGLFLAAARFARARVIAEVDAASAHISDPLEHWRRAIHAFLRFFDANPDVVELLIEERSLTKGQRASTFFENQGERNRRWRALFQRLIDDGHIRQLPIDQIEQAVSRHLFGTLFVHYYAGRPAPLADQFECLFDVLMNGLGRQG